MLDVRRLIDPERMELEAIQSDIRRRVTVTPAGCWLWPSGRGWYGTATDADGRSRKAHRVAYEAFRGLIPAGLQIDHLCRTPSCVNPAHLEVVTPAENNRRRSLAQTHCRAGHLLPPGGTGAERRCRECRRIDEAARRARANDPTLRTRQRRAMLSPTTVSIPSRGMDGAA